MDPRVREYAKLLVERCIDVQPGWQVLVVGTPPARPLLEEVSAAIGRRGAYALLRLGFDAINGPWTRTAPQALLSKLPPLEEQLHQEVDAKVVVVSPENTKALADLSPEQLGAVAQARKPIGERHLSLTFPWVGCQYPTPALAQEAGMTLDQFADFLYGACLIDWDEEARKMRRIADRFDAADEVRIVGADTDLTLSLAGRHGHVDDGHLNMPGGEVFYSPVEDSANGVVTFSEFPAVYISGTEVRGARLVFENGRVVEASADAGESELIGILDTDEGARRLGELGIGCNPGIQRHMKNTLFDEKIYGTIHLAVGRSFPFLGGKNESAVHWDIVKDVRTNGQIYCDGELVQENGEWKF